MFLPLKEFYEYDEVEYYPNNNVKEQVGSEPSQNPQQWRQKKNIRSFLDVKRNETMLLEDWAMWVWIRFRELPKYVSGKSGILTKTMQPHKEEKI